MCEGDCLIHFGIDVGVTGAIGAIEDKTGAFIGLQDLPLIELGVWKFVDGPQLLTILREMRGAENARCYMEYAGGMGGPTFGKTAIASLNRMAGSIVATLMLAGLPLDLVAPTTWKRAFGLTKPKDSKVDMKAKSLALARMKFPGAGDVLTRAKDHNRGECLLLAEYGRMRWSNANATLDLRPSAPPPF